MPLKFLQRLLPKSRRARGQWDDDKLRALFATVRENDPVLEAVKSLLEDQLESDAMLSMSVSQPDTMRLRACDGMRATYTVLQRIEEVHKTALEWRKRLDAEG